MDLEKAIASSDFVAAAKVFDKELRSGAGSDPDKAQLLCNRAFCYQQAGLLRKALKVKHCWTLVKALAPATHGNSAIVNTQDFVEASRLDKANSRASVGRGEVLYVLKRLEVRSSCLCKRSDALYSRILIPVLALLQEAKTSWHDAATQPSPTSDISVAFRAAALLKDAEGLLLHPNSMASSSAANTASDEAKANGHASAVDMSRACQIPQVIIQTFAAGCNVSAAVKPWLLFQD